jgi:hypothetical protein
VRRLHKIVAIVLLVAILLSVAVTFASSFIRRSRTDLIGVMDELTSTTPIDQIAADFRKPDRRTRDRASMKLFYYPRNTITQAEATLLARSLIENAAIDRAESKTLRYPIGSAAPIVAAVFSDEYSRALAAGDRVNAARVITVSHSVTRRFDGVDNPDPKDVLQELQRIAALGDVH